jgi:hypothetical protein
MQSLKQLNQTSLRNPQITDNSPLCCANIIPPTMYVTEFRLFSTISANPLLQIIFYLRINKPISLVAEAARRFPIFDTCPPPSLNSKTSEKLKAMRAATVISMIHACVAINVGKA